MFVNYENNLLKLDESLPMKMGYPVRINANVPNIFDTNNLETTEVFFIIRLSTRVLKGFIKLCFLKI